MRSHHWPTLLILFAAASCAAQEVVPVVKHPTRFDISPKKLSEITPITRNFRGAQFLIHKIRKLDNLGDFRGIADPVVQTKAGGPAAFAAPTGFEGIGAGLQIASDTTFQVHSMPPDIAGAAGIDQYVQWVNTSFAVFDKQGTLKYGPAEGRTIWTGFGGPCETSNDGDPVVLFDRLARRWLLAQFAVSEEPFSECIAVSLTDDATGKYARYQYDFDLYNDYPKFAVWPNGYYATYNMFKGPTRETPAGSRTCVYDRQKMLLGQTADAQCADLNVGGLLPSDMEGTAAPAPTPPNLLLAVAKSGLKLWKFTTDWKDPTKSRLGGPTTITVQPFIPACPRGPCIPEPSPGNPLDAIGDRLMFRNSFRRRGSVESLLVTHSVFVSGFGGPNSTGFRWYEVSDPFGAPAIAQQATYAPDAVSRWLGSIAMDKVGNIAIGYNASSATLGPSIFLTGRSASGPPSLLSAETPVIIGKGSQSFEEFGDYSTMTLDPIDDCTFWFTSEYLLDPNKDHRWHTYIAHTKFPDCQ